MAFNFPANVLVRRAGRCFHPGDDGIEQPQASPLAKAGGTWRVQPETLYDRYNRDFECILADRPNLLRSARIEDRFEDSAERPTGLEQDQVDGQAVHCILNIRPTGETIGIARLCLPKKETPSFSLSELRDYYGGHISVLQAQTAEVSRFFIAKSLWGGTNRELLSHQSASRHIEPLISLGLIQGLVRMSMWHGITHWSAVMKPQLLRALAAIGINFIPVGALMEHQGLRQLCYCNVEAVLQSVKRLQPSFWEILTDAGMLSFPGGGG